MLSAPTNFESHRQGAVVILLLACFSPIAISQTPSPLQEWQYSGGVILARLFEPDVPEFRRILGIASEVEPLYSGARADKVQGGPVISIYYRDIAFLSTGDGIGYNILRGDHYQVGVAMAYDLGRSEQKDLNSLRGLGDIGAAPVAKVFGTWVLSKKFPLILRTDVRQFICHYPAAPRNLSCLPDPLSRSLRITICKLSMASRRTSRSRQDTRSTIRTQARVLRV